MSSGLGPSLTCLLQIPLCLNLQEASRVYNDFNDFRDFVTAFPALLHPLLNVHFLLEIYFISLSLYLFGSLLKLLQFWVLAWGISFEIGYA